MSDRPPPVTKTDTVLSQNENSFTLVVTEERQTQREGGKEWSTNINVHVKTHTEGGGGIVFVLVKYSPDVRINKPSPFPLCALCLCINLLLVAPLRFFS